MISSYFYLTSADWHREVPDRHAGCVGYTGEQWMSVQDVAGDAAVADLVTYAELSAIQYAFGRNPWVSTGAAPQLWRTWREGQYRYEQ